MTNYKSIYKSITHILLLAFISLACVIIITLTIRGDKGEPLAYQNDYNRFRGGPFESSNSSGRYALVKSIVDNRSFALNDDLASFSSPDLVFYNNKFYSIFTPGISFVSIPFYILGKQFGIPQLTTYLSTALFALCNLFLVAYIARRFGANIYTSVLGGFLFVFGTNALAYAHSLTQHSLSTTLLLLGIANAFGDRSVVKNLLFGTFFGAAILMDIPNIFLFMPMAIYILCKHFIIHTNRKETQIGLRISILALIFGILPFILIFGWYNHLTTGSYTTIGQFVGRTSYEDARSTKPLPAQENDSVSESTKLPLTTRSQLNGAYILLLSNERAWIYYSPFLFLGLIGIISSYYDKEKRFLVTVMVSVVLMNILIYTMFDDPWGGWAFGPRYLIPAASIMSIFTAVAFQKYARNILFFFLFTTLSLYSLAVSITGAATSSAVPPRVEAIHFQTPTPYTYEFNIRLMQEGSISSLFYNLYLDSKISSIMYVVVICIFSSLVLIILESLGVLYRRKEDR